MRSLMSGSSDHPHASSPSSRFPAPFAASLRTRPLRSSRPRVARWTTTSPRYERMRRNPTAQFAVSLRGPHGSADPPTSVIRDRRSRPPALRCREHGDHLDQQIIPMCDQGRSSSLAAAGSVDLLTRAGRIGGFIAWRDDGSRVSGAGDTITPRLSCRDTRPRPLSVTRRLTTR